MSTDRHTRELRRDASFVARMAAAYRDGLTAGRAGVARRNPWRGLDDDPRGRVLAKMWQRGYSAGNPVRLP